MKNLSGFLCALTVVGAALVCPLSRLNADVTPAVPPAAPQSTRHLVMEDSDLRTFHSAIANRDYELYISVPGSAKQHPEKKYPVVYLTDAYWSFMKVCTIAGSLWYDRITPEFIIVGIGYAGDNVDYGAERMYELSPTEQHYSWMANFKGRQGGSRLFLDSFKKEIIPYVESHTHADPSFRVLAGTSLGGLFCLYSMYEEPELFQGIICSAPAVIWGDRWIFQREMQLKKQFSMPSGKGVMRIPTRLYMTASDGEWPAFDGDILAFDQIIKHAGYKDFAYDFRNIDGERHGGNVAETYERGLRFVFFPQMP